MKLSGRTFYIFGSVILLLALAYVFLWIFPVMQKSAYRAQFPAEKIESFTATERIQFEKNSADIENSTRLTLAQIVGGLALLSGLFLTYLNVRAAQDNARSAQENIKVAQKNLRITEEGKLTDRFSKAVELLGSPDMELRLGGIYALERIASDSQKDHWTVMEVLTAFVRGHSHIDLAHIGNLPETIRRREDIQTIMTVIGRRKWIKSETRRLDLTYTNLSLVRLVGANLSNLDLTGAILESADLRFVDLSNSDLFDADLTKTFLSGAELRSTEALVLAQISSAIFYTLPKLPSRLLMEWNAALKAKQTEETKTGVASPETSAEE